MDREFAFGGVVSRGDEVLLVEVTNLKGERKWTFPKGHPEKGESSQETALREVREETGWTCRIKDDLITVEYKFSRQGRLVDKKVRWFWMEPVEETGAPDAVEVHEARWVCSDEAFKMLSYPGDLELLAEWKKKAFMKGNAEPQRTPRAQRNAEDGKRGRRVGKAKRSLGKHVRHRAH